MRSDIRIAISRAFAVWIILIVGMSSPSSTVVPPSVRVYPSATFSAKISGAPTSKISGTPTSVQRKVSPPTRPTNATVCLAQALFFEARGEPAEGLQAVAATVFNRVEHADYASSICGVVYQPYQYSWTLIRENWARRPPTKFIRLAKEFIQNRAKLQDQYPVTHYHHANIHPTWANTLEYITTIGQHKFYRG